MAFPIISTFQSSVHNHPKIQSNAFLNKLHPCEYRPEPQVPRVNASRWCMEFVGVLATESLKSIKRTTPITVFDNLNMALALSMVIHTARARLKTFAQNPSLASATIGVGAFAATSLGSVLVWALGFYASHHLPRKLNLNLLNPDNLTTSLKFSVESNELTKDETQAIEKVALNLQKQQPEVPPALIKGIVTETLLGNWQLNHAYQHFNAQAKGLFPEILKQLLTLDSSASNNGDRTAELIRPDFEAAIASANVSGIKAQMHLLPKSLQTQLEQLFDQRLFRNLTCFAVRAIREQRNTPTNFEKQHIHTWLNEYQALHSLPILHADAETIVNLMKAAMQAFGEQGLAPKKIITVDETTKMLPAAWPKKLEQQLARQLNYEHQHTAHNLEVIPKAGRAIIAFNHSLFTGDISMGMQAIREQIQRDPTMVIDEALMSLPIIGSSFHGLGYRLGERSKFIELLTEERVMAVAPGGAAEAVKPYEKANQLRWGSAKGFVRAHLVTGAKLITLVSPQADQLRKNKLSPIAHWLQRNVFSTLKVTFLPIFLAPFARERVRVDHFANTPFEAPPMPVNNLSNTDMRFKNHVNTIHKQIWQESQGLLNRVNEQVLTETPNRTYPLAVNSLTSSQHAKQT